MNVPPIAERRPIVRSHHGDDFVDEDENAPELTTPETMSAIRWISSFQTRSSWLGLWVLP